MRLVVDLERFKIPDIHLPEGYSIRRGINYEEGIETWNYLLSHFRAWPFPTDRGDAVFFAYFNDTPVGCLAALLTSGQRNVALFQAGFVLEEHRRRGLFTALVMECLRYCKDNGKRYVRIAARPFLDDLWRGLGIVNE